MIPGTFGKAIAALLFFTGLSATTLAQFPYGLVDKRDHQYCRPCIEAIEAKPKEVLFGISISNDGSVYFSMDNMEWFNKIVKSERYGITIDLISKKKYSCGGSAANTSREGLPLGTVLPPVYKKELLAGNLSSQGGILVKVGKLPSSLAGDEVESNLIILNGNFVCYYTNFVNIARNAWEILPMGLFTDSLVRDTKMYDTAGTDFFTYTKKEQLVIPFEKGSASFSTRYLKHFFDSIGLSQYKIRKAEIRAYSSVEGQEVVNKMLMKKRADTITKALKLYYPSLNRFHVITAENWLEYFESIKTSDVEELKQLTKADTRKKLIEKVLTARIEPLLAQQRKAVVTVYLEGKTGVSFTTEQQMLNAFKKAIAEKNIETARLIQKEIVDEIADNRLPSDYMDRLEVPQTKDFSSLLNDREVYKYLLKTTSEYEAYGNFLALQKIDPSNGHINYNICALSFFLWQYGGDTTISKTLLHKINGLLSNNINETLVKRMQINYHILKCEDDMRLYRYDDKDSSVDFIYNIYQNLQLDDDDIYLLAKYFAYYSRLDYAEEIVTPRVDKLDVSEDLLFFYINTQFYFPDSYETEKFKKAVLNAVSLNPKRYCDFFLPNDKGGASMQLLEYEELKKIYCESCR